MAEEKKPRFPEPTFSNFVASLASSVLIQLGIFPDPKTGERKTDLELAKHTIDLLSMLQEKTRGNLTEEEDRMLREVLAELKLRYVEVCSQEKKEEGKKCEDG